MAGNLGANELGTMLGLMVERFGVEFTSPNGNDGKRVSVLWSELEEWEKEITLVMDEYLDKGMMISILVTNKPLEQRVVGVEDGEERDFEGRIVRD